MREAFRYRGVFLDISRGKIPQMNYLKALITWLAERKVNVFQLYCEDKVALDSHPKIGRVTGTLSKEEVAELAKYCEEHGIELQPCFQTFSHMHGVLRTPGYENMSENAGLFSFSVCEPAVLNFISDEFEEVLPLFRSHTVNLNMDEAYDLGTGKSKDLVSEQGKGRTYLNFILEVAAVARINGTTKIQIWGDLIQNHPGLVSQLPDDVILMDWNYNNQETYPSLDAFEKSGRTFWAAGGTGTWDTIFPRIHTIYRNMSEYCAEAAEKGAEGFLITDWGDYGHMQPAGLSLYEYAIGTRQMLDPSRVEDPKEWEDALFPEMFRDRRVEDAFRQLIHSDTAEGIQTGFKSMSIYAFFDDMLSGLSVFGNENYPKARESALEILQEDGVFAGDLLREALKDPESKVDAFDTWYEKELFGRTFARELLLVADMMAFAGEKQLLGLRIRKEVEGGLSERKILERAFRIHLLYAKLQKIRSEFVSVWKLRSREIGIETSLSMFDQLGVSLAEATRWLGAQRLKIDRGEDPENTLDSYVRNHPHCILWTADFENLWDRAYPWQ